MSYRYTKYSNGAYSYTIAIPKEKPVYKNNIYGALLTLADEKYSESRREHFNKIGNSRVNVERGTEDRLNAIPYNNLSTDSMETISYNYGYYEKGTRTISAKIDILSEEELELIGYNDSKDSNIDLNSMPEVIKTNPYYLKGYYNKKGRRK